MNSCLIARGWAPIRAGIACGAILIALPSSSAPLGPVPDDPVEVIEWLNGHWKENGWGAEGNPSYMRALDDRGWQARMLAMQKMVTLDAVAVPALTAALDSEVAELQIFAAQTFGYLAGHAPTKALTRVLRESPSAAARLYAADTLGMRGGAEFKQLFAAQAMIEKNRDVKKHLAYALERAGTPVQPEVTEALKRWDPGTINSAVIDKPAPDFELRALNGEMVKLSQYRGKAAVVLVFIYGDT